TQCDGKQQIVIVDTAVAVAIKIGKVFDHLDAALLKNFQIEIRLDALHFAANVESMIAVHGGVRVGELEAPLLRLLRHTERRTVLNTRKRQLWTRRDRQRVVAKSAEAEREIVD